MVVECEESGLIGECEKSPTSFFFSSSALRIALPLLEHTRIHTVRPWEGCQCGNDFSSPLPLLKFRPPDLHPPSISNFRRLTRVSDLEPSRRRDADPPKVLVRLLTNNLCTTLTTSHSLLTYSASHATGTAPNFAVFALFPSSRLLSFTIRARTPELPFRTFLFQRTDIFETFHGFEITNREMLFLERERKREVQKQVEELERWGLSGNPLEARQESPLGINKQSPHKREIILSPPFSPPGMGKRQEKADTSQ